MIRNELNVRIRYADTDQMGIVYYAEYLKYFEDGRSSFLRNIGLSYSFIESELGLYMPVIESYVKYYKSAKFEDELVVETLINDMPSRTILFNCNIYKDSILLVKGHTKHVFVDKNNQIKTCPKEILSVFNEKWTGE